MSKTADEAWADADKKYSPWLLRMLLRKAVEASAREIAREEIAEVVDYGTTRFHEFEARVERLGLRVEGRLDKIEARVQHLYDVRDEDLQAEQEREDWTVTQEVLDDASYIPAPSEPQPQGGDADESGGSDTSRSDVATGAGATSEQDPPAPSEGEEGEVEPVGLAPAEVAAMGWDYKSFIVYRDDPGFSTTPLYSHETVQRLQTAAETYRQLCIEATDSLRTCQRERDEEEAVSESLRDVVDAFRDDRNRLRGDVRVLRRKLEDAKAEIAHLRDPGNWTAFADYRAINVVANALSVAFGFGETLVAQEIVEQVQATLDIRYTGPEGEGESDEG